MSGSATDGERIYVAIGNLYGIAYNNAAGSWSALDPVTGKILWQTSDPDGALDLGPVAATQRRAACVGGCCGNTHHRNRRGPPSPALAGP